ncbi:MAG: YciI-like protein [Bacteroidia bacterium]
MYYLLFYQLVDDYLERRVPLRAAHLQLAHAAQEAGTLVMAGALADPADGAVLVFRDAESATVFARQDPYVAQGLVVRWYVRPWNVVVGGT